jgi:hypothetical protein
VPGFSECQQSSGPQMDFKDAFVLWRGLGNQLRRGRASASSAGRHPFHHRLGALAATIALIAGAPSAIRWRPGRQSGARSRPSQCSGARPAALHRRLDGPRRLPARAGHGAQRRAPHLLLLSTLALARYRADQLLEPATGDGSVRHRTWELLTLLLPFGPSNGPRRSPDTLQRGDHMPSNTPLDRALANEQEVLSEWVQSQLAATTLRSDLMSEARPARADRVNSFSCSRAALGSEPFLADCGGVGSGARVPQFGVDERAHIRASRPAKPQRSCCR